MVEGHEMMEIVPGGVWYLLSLAFAGALFWVIRLSVIEQKKINKELSDAVRDINSMLKLHEWRLDKIENNGPKKRGQ